MLSIRLARVGRENLQTFRLVAQEKTTSPKRGKIVESLGFYNPTHPENQLDFDAEKVKKLIGNGAEVSDTVARLLIKNGFEKALVEKFVKKYIKRKSKKAEEEKPAEAPKAENAPAEEAKPEGDAKPVAEEAKAENEEKPKEETPPAEDSPSEASAKDGDANNSNQANESDDEAKKE